MIYKIPAWHANIFVALVAVHYLLFVLGMQFANEEMVETKNERLLFPMWTRLGVIAWLLGTAMIAITQQKAMQSQPNLEWILIGISYAGVIVLIGLSSLHRLADEIPLQWILGIQTLRAAVPFLIPSDSIDLATSPDLIIGLSAPVLALFYYIFGYRIRWTLITWSLASILLTFFMLVPLDRMTEFFPFIWFPTFITPLTIVFHVLALRKAWLKETP
jgi:hypothetical protein